MGSENNMVAVMRNRMTAAAELETKPGEAHAFRHLARYATDAAIARLASPQPDVQQGEPTVADLAGFGASDTACYLYPGDHQRPEREAFCEGASWMAVAPPSPALDAATIERCAEVAESFDSCGVDSDPTHFIPCEIAAAIRALPNAEKR